MLPPPKHAFNRCEILASMDEPLEDDIVGELLGGAKRRMWKKRLDGVGGDVCGRHVAEAAMINPLSPPCF